MAGVMNNMMEKLHLSKKKPQGAPAQEPKQEDLQALREKYERAEQDHVFHYYDELEVADKASLFEQLSDIDPEKINKIFDKVVGPVRSKKGDSDRSEKEEKTEDDDSKSKDDDDEEKRKNDKDKPDLQPLPAEASVSLLDVKDEEAQEWYDHGLSLIAENKVAVVLMAGGQGTRLGSSDPKGCFNIGLPSTKSLFQLQAERIYKIQQLAARKHGKDSVIVPWYILTSRATDGPTKEFFEKHKYFGLDEANVTFFEQGVLPCLSDEGKILMEDKSQVSVAPDGNGGLYMALFLGSVLSDMSKRGIEHVHAYCVDNCLAKVADPTFIGFSAGKGVDIATKVVRKRDAQEPVGLILQKNGKPDVIEYSEMDEEMAKEKDLKNSDLLKFRAANIVNHYYSYSFLESIPQWAPDMPHHVARKKIPYLDMDNDKKVKPEKPNGIKLEQFVFDCFNLLSMDKFACMEVKREDEFAPLKNAAGKNEDDPDTSRKHILEQGRRWVEYAGGVVTGEGEGVEVSPLISYGGEGLESVKGKTLKLPAVIEREIQS